MKGAIDETAIREGLGHLAGTDPDVARGLALVGHPPPRVREHGLGALVNVIVSQQVSKEAAAAIAGRLHALAPGMEPEALLALSEHELRGAGLSRPKVAYVRGVAAAVADGTLDLEAMPDLPDAAAIEALVALKGIGQWSAEVYCMFSLGRRDIFPAGDLALREALRRLKGLPERPAEAEARAVTAAWSPWRSVGALFLWHYYRGAPQ